VAKDPIDGFQVSKTQFPATSLVSGIRLWPAYAIEVDRRGQGDFEVRE